MLNEPSDARSLAFVGAFFVLQALLYLGVLPWFVALGAFPALLFLATIGAVVNHNALHTPVFQRRALERVFRVVLSLEFGLPVAVYVPVHNHSHHRFSQTRRDVTRTSKVRFRWNLLNLLRIPSRVAPDSLRGDIAWFVRKRADGSPEWTHLKRELAALVLVDLALLVFDPLAFLLYVFVPQQVAQSFIMMINFIQHDGCDPDHTGFDFARNFTGPLFNWFYLNNGFHTLHHRRPGVHWSRLPALHATEIAPHIDPALEIERFLPFLWRYAVSPGLRVDLHGEPFEPPPDEGDLSWLSASPLSETSDRLAPE